MAAIAEDSSVALRAALLLPAAGLVEVEEENSPEYLLHLKAVSSSTPLSLADVRVAILAVNGVLAEQRALTAVAAALASLDPEMLYIALGSALWEVLLHSLLIRPLRGTSTLRGVGGR